MSSFNRRQFIQRAGAAAAALSYLSNATAQVARSNIMDIPTDFGSDKNVFCDWRDIEAGYGLISNPDGQKPAHSGSFLMPYGVRLRTGRPRLSEQPIIVADKPTDGIYIGAYSTLLRDGGKFRLWYESYLTLKSDAGAQICYAESEDGFTWTKPNVGIFEYHGSKNNNVVFKHGHGASIFIDPTASSSARYKMIHLDQVPLQMVNGEQLSDFLFGAISPDGIHWERLQKPLLKYTSDTQSVAEYDPISQKYVAYLRGWDPGSRPGYGRRIVVRTESSEFENFPEPVPVLSMGPQDPADADIYTNAYQRWPGARQAYLMTPAIYHRSSDHVDLQLATSRDGTRWQFSQREPFIPDGAAGSGYEGAIYAGRGTISIEKGTWAFPVSRYRGTHNTIFKEVPGQHPGSSLWLARLPEDGYISLEAEDDGECWTLPASFTGSQLLINSWGMSGSRVMIELADKNGTPFPNFSLADCDGLSGEQLWSPVTWRGNSNVGVLNGKLVRIRFSLHRARVHAFRFA